MNVPADISSDEDEGPTEDQPFGKNPKAIIQARLFKSFPILIYFPSFHFIMYCNQMERPLAFLFFFLFSFCYTAVCAGPSISRRIQIRYPVLFTGCTEWPYIPSLLPPGVLQVWHYYDHNNNKNYCYYLFHILFKRHFLIGDSGYYEYHVISYHYKSIRILILFLFLCLYCFLVGTSLIVRFTLCPYSYDEASIGDPLVHLTNAAIQKKHPR